METICETGEHCALPAAEVCGSLTAATVLDQACQALDYKWGPKALPDGANEAEKTEAEKLAAVFLELHLQHTDATEKQNETAAELASASEKNAAAWKHLCHCRSMFNRAGHAKNPGKQAEKWSPLIDQALEAYNACKREVENADALAAEARQSVNDLYNPHWSARDGLHSFFRQVERRLHEERQAAIAAACDEVLAQGCIEGAACQYSLDRGYLNELLKRAAKDSPLHLSMHGNLPFGRVRTRGGEMVYSVLGNWRFAHGGSEPLVLNASEVKAFVAAGGHSLINIQAGLQLLFMGSGGYNVKATYFDSVIPGFGELQQGEHVCGWSAAEVAYIWRNMLSVGEKSSENAIHYTNCALWAADGSWCATDGHSLSAWSTDKTHEADLVISLSTLEQVCKFLPPLVSSDAKLRKNPEIRLCKTAEDGGYYFWIEGWGKGKSEHEPQRVYFTAPDIKFPDFRRVLSAHNAANEVRSTALACRDDLNCVFEAAAPIAARIAGKDNNPVVAISIVDSVLSLTADSQELGRVVIACADGEWQAPNLNPCLVLQALKHVPDAEPLTLLSASAVNPFYMKSARFEAVIMPIRKD